MVEEIVAENQSSLWVEAIANSVINSFNSLAVYIQEVFPEKCRDLLDSLIITVISACSSFFELLDSSFSEFQVRLLQVLLGILSIHIVAICIAWKVYSNRITDRFLRPSQQITTDQLRSAVNELKLPAEHTPRW